MGDLEQRIIELEQRIEKLERLNQNVQHNTPPMMRPNNQNQNVPPMMHQNNQNNNVPPMMRPNNQNQNVPPMIHPNNQNQNVPPMMRPNNQNNNAINPIHHRVQQNMPVQNKSQNNKLKEEFVGKYLIGSFAALLVFIGAFSLLALVWDNLSPISKLTLIIATGMALSITGFTLLKKKRNHITSIILGTGGGLVFIGIISAYIPFELINSFVCIFLVCLWSLFFILSSKYTKLYFTSIIGYIGSYITVIMALFRIDGVTHLLTLVVFVLFISTALIYNSYSSDKKDQYLIISLLLSLFSFGTIFCHIIGLAFFIEEPIYGAILPIIILLTIYLLSSFLYKIVDRKPVQYWQVIIAFFVSCITVIFLETHFEMSAVSMSSIMFIICFINMMAYILYFKNTRELFVYYFIIMMIRPLLIMVKFYTGDVIGLVILAILLLGIEKAFKMKLRIAILCLLLIDILLCAVFSSHSIAVMIFQLLHVILTIYLLYKCYLIKEGNHLRIMKILYILVSVVNTFFIIFIFLTKLLSVTDETRFTIPFIITVAVLFGNFAAGLYKDWNDDRFKIFTKNDEVADDNLMVFHNVIVTVMYFIGNALLGTVTNPVNKFIVLMVTIIIALMQSFILIKRYKNNTVVGFWIGTKYLILLWRITYVYSEMGVSAIRYSILGLAIAFLSIYIGFIIKFKGLRLYGLVLTILMVSKVVLIDLLGQNSIVIVISLILGGLLCFGISVLYNKLNVETNKEE